jgi:hypothetical protein
MFFNFWKKKHTKELKVYCKHCDREFTLGKDAVVVSPLGFVISAEKSSGQAFAGNRSREKQNNLVPCILI